ncbi:SDR family oxidoreductase [Aggregatilinea lenta]|uniref:SDR family oxidoreductase n=1 Tax=Aggregatilinea lenta TaxID=913108 RepID=UPI000E5AC323|nr:SDR family oxidoreductase [Aggregatilinea lenta]
MASILDLFDLTGKTAVVTGGCGVLCSAIAQGLASAGARVVLLDRDTERLPNCAGMIPGEPLGLYADVLDAGMLADVADEIEDRAGPVDILVNCAGGNRATATTGDGRTFFDLPPEALRAVIDLNLMGTLIPSQVFGRHMAERGEGVILNVSSMNAFRPLTRIAGYSAAKAAVSNFTQWLAVHLAQEYGAELRVNAIAPGFFMTQQNKFLLTDEATGALTERGRQILDHTPAGRFGAPEDLLGAVLWLVSPASAFVTGVVVPIDGGFSAFSGV